MTTQLNERVCLWCGSEFVPRRDGGKRQLFCRLVCRREFDAAGRRLVVEAIATGVLTVQALKNGPTAMRALVPAATSPASESEVPPQHPAPATPRAESRYTRQQDLEWRMAHAI
jgi:hypothetical protein